MEWYVGVKMIDDNMEKYDNRLFSTNVEKDLCLENIPLKDINEEYDDVLEAVKKLPDKVCWADDI